MSGDDTLTLPRGLVEIAEVIGAAKAVALADKWGGIETYIPKTPGPDHCFVPVIGLDAVRQLAAVWPGQTINPPRGVFRHLKKRLILELLGQASHRQIALRARVTTRYVERLAADSRGVKTAVPPRQLSLIKD